MGARPIPEGTQGPMGARPIPEGKRKALEKGLKPRQPAGDPQGNLQRKKNKGPAGVQSARNRQQKVWGGGARSSPQKKTNFKNLKLKILKHLKILKQKNWSVLFLGTQKPSTKEQTKTKNT